jgi:C4-dicarboxylate-binding protein DctP
MKQFKLLAPVISMILILNVVSAFCVGAAEAKNYKARLATSWPTKHLSAKATRIFADNVEKFSNGKLKITIYDSGQLYGSKDWIDALSAGSINFGASFLSTAQRNLREISASSIPFVFNGYDELYQFFKEDKTGKNVWGIFEKKTGIKLVTLIPNGSIVFWAAKGITSIKDFKGMDARVPMASYVIVMKALGCNPVTMPSKEVYQALQSGMVKGYISNISGPFAFSYTDFSKVLCLPNFGVSMGLLAVNTAWFDGLPDDIQKAVMDAGQAAYDATANNLGTEEERLIKKFETELKGKIYRYTDAELKQMKQIVIDEVLPKESKSWDSPHAAELLSEVKNRLD